MKVAILVGSLREASFTRKIAKAVSSMFPEEYDVEFVEIGDLPLYDQDYDDKDRVPEEYTRFRRKMNGMDAVLFATPEYNRSVPAVLKNSLDVGSRPYGSSVWDGKPAAVVSVSPGAIGGFGANHHLRQSLVFLNMPVLQQPEAYIGRVMDILDDNGKISNVQSQEFLQQVVDAFVALIKHYPINK